jgi:hypothetical protein
MRIISCMRSQHRRDIAPCPLISCCTTTRKRLCSP